MAFGVAVPEELSEVVDEICNQAVVKPLGRKGFLILFRPEQVSYVAFALATAHLHIHLARMRARKVFCFCSVLSATGRSLKGSCACALARVCVRSASAAAFGAHLAMYRIHRQNHGICSSVATGALGKWCAFGSSGVPTARSLDYTVPWRAAW